MIEDDKKYFEELAHSKDTVYYGAEGAEEEDFKVTLVKAGGNIVSRPKVAPKENNLESHDDEPEGQLTIDVYQDGDEIIVESAIAGVNPDNIDINVTNESITIRGERTREKNLTDKDYFYQECYWGKFSRSVILPQEIDPEKAYAKFKNGILTVHLPKVSRQKTKKLKVRLE